MIGVYITVYICIPLPHRHFHKTSEEEVKDVISAFELQICAHLVQETCLYLYKMQVNEAFL